jgi:hypothetical protein
MAFHGIKMAKAGKPNPYSNAPGYTDVEYDWLAMETGTDAKAIKAIGVL